VGEIVVTVPDVTGPASPFPPKNPFPLENAAVRVIVSPMLIVVLLAVKDEMVGAAIALTIALPVETTPPELVTEQVNVQAPTVLGAV